MFYEFMFEYLFCVIFIRSDHLSLWRFAQFLLPSWGVLLQSLVQVLVYYFSHITLYVVINHVISIISIQNVHTKQTTYCLI